MREVLSVAVFDPDDTITVEDLAKAVKDYRSMVIPCSSQSIVLSDQPATRRFHCNWFQEPFQQTLTFLSQIRTQAPGAEVVFLSEFDDETLWVWVEAIQHSVSGPVSQAG